MLTYIPMIARSGCRGQYVIFQAEQLEGVSSKNGHVA